MTEKNKFKRGDIVKLKSPSSRNAEYFKKTGVDYLEIDKCIDETTCYVWTKDKSTRFFVDIKELELQKEPKIFIFRKKTELKEIKN